MSDDADGVQAWKRGFDAHNRDVATENSRMTPVQRLGIVFELNSWRPTLNALRAGVGPLPTGDPSDPDRWAVLRRRFRDR
jgi:hypothetical protein